MMKRILFVGPLVYGNTTIQRLRAFQELGHQVVSVDTATPQMRQELFLALRILWRLGIHPDMAGANFQMLNQVNRNTFDLVWIEKGLTISAKTLVRMKKIQPSCLSVSINLDDIMNKRIQSRRYLAALPFHDMVITPRECNIQDFKALGVRNVLRMKFAYDPHTHRPLHLNDREKQKWGCEVGFAAAFGKDRFKRMLSLAQAGQAVVIRGPNWEAYKNKHPFLSVKPGFIAGDDYARAICGSKINLSFLRKINRDLHTQRSVEIPACGAFMLAERTSEHLEMFEEGKEADFFGSDGELIDKVKYYLKNEAERQRIARAGRERCLRSGYSNHERLNEVLLYIEKHFK
jgi:spore maturation protein CgeB